MPARLRWALTLTDLGFLAYWTVAGAACAGWLHMPPAWMYAGYGEARTDAWNWSFLPLDLAFSAAGLWAVRLSVQGDGRWRTAALVSLILTTVAGGMAVGYWTLLGEFRPEWFLPNLALMLWPAPFLAMLLREGAVSP